MVYDVILSRGEAGGDSPGRDVEYYLALSSSVTGA
jgi:hypothetical protein